MAGTLTACVALLAAGEFDKVWNLLRLQVDSKTVVMSVLHGFGSIFTNIGFLFGKAAMVQAVKLLEPFLTLFWSCLLFPEDQQAMKPTTILSIVMVVSASIMLVKNGGNKNGQRATGTAIAFAMLSGFSLSSRNVLQRKFFQSKNETATAATQQDSTRHKVVKSIENFGRLSLWGALVNMAISILALTLNGKVMFNRYIVEDHALFVWHPLYNLFSIVTLGFCSALTHSLLNSGKRVVAICMGFLWFSEELSPDRLAALAVSLMGGLLYARDSKKKK